MCKLRIDSRSTDCSASRPFRLPTLLQMVGHDHSLLARGEGAQFTRHSFPSFLALLFVMFECRLQTADHFRSGLEERLRFRFIYFVNVAAQMFDKYPKFLPNIRGMHARIF